jgi:hypothetical protein
LFDFFSFVGYDFSRFIHTHFMFGFRDAPQPNTVDRLALNLV